MKYITTVNDETFEIEINHEGDLVVNGEVHAVDFKSMGQIYSLLLDNQSFEAIVEKRDGLYFVLMDGDMYEVDVTDEREMRLANTSSSLAASGGEIGVRSPMPGMIVAVSVEEGQAVSRGDTVVILESMKMQNELKAPRDGEVHHVMVQPGDSVEQNQVLVTLH